MEDLNPRASGAKTGMSKGFLAIIFFKWLKAATFLVFAIAALRLGRAPAMPTAVQIADTLSVSRENALVHRVADLIRPLTPRQATGIGYAFLLVGVVFFVEGTLLLLRVWWSTYFTIVLTALGLPLELYEIAHRPVSPRRYLLLAVNLAILIYLWKKRHEFQKESAVGSRRSTPGV